VITKKEIIIPVFFRFVSCRESKRKEKKHVEGKKIQELNYYLW